MMIPVMLLVLLQPRIAKVDLFWAIISTFIGVVILVDWHYVDNHKFVLVYWCGALFLSLWGDERGQHEMVLKFNARYLLVIVFLGAVAWKTMSPTYLTSSFLEFSILSDPRFDSFTSLFVGDMSDIRQQRLIMKEMEDRLLDSSLTTSITVPIGVARVATVLTWYEYSIQLLIGLLFLCHTTWLLRAAHLLLIFFIYTTYFFLPLVGFGIVLSLMGWVVADDTRLKGAYAFAALLLPLFSSDLLRFA